MFYIIRRRPYILLIRFTTTIRIPERSKTSVKILYLET